MCIELPPGHRVRQLRRWQLRAELEDETISTRSRGPSVPGPSVTLLQVHTNCVDSSLDKCCIHFYSSKLGVTARCPFVMWSVAPTSWSSSDDDPGFTAFPAINSVKEKNY